MKNSKLQFKNKNYDIKHRTYYFSIEVIKFLQLLPKGYIYQTIGQQLLRSSASIGANIIEAQAASSRKEFMNFMNYALKSANETKYWLCLLRDGLKVKPESVAILLSEADELSKILGASMLRLKGRR